jgi:hypothetical protein
MITPIANSELRLHDLPLAGDGLEAHGLFAQSFDGYQTWGDDCARMANVWAGRWRAERKLPETLTEVRGCLFFEQRRRHEMSSDYVLERLPEYDVALLARLAALLESGASDTERDAVTAWRATNPRPGDWDSDGLRLLLQEVVAHATHGVDEAVAGRSGQWGVEDDLRNAVVDALRERGELVLTEAQVGVPNWSRNLGGFDFAVAGRDGGLVVGETKWANGNLYECLWDLLKLASASTMPRIGAAVAVYGAPVKHWEKPVACADLFETGVYDTAKLLGAYATEWQRNLDGTKARPHDLPIDFRVEPIVKIRTEVLGKEWEVRAVEVASNDAWTWLEDGWPPSSRPARV